MHLQLAGLKEFQKKEDIYTDITDMYKYIDLYVYIYMFTYVYQKTTKSEKKRNTNEQPGIETANQKEGQDTNGVSFDKFFRCCFVLNAIAHYFHSDVRMRRMPVFVSISSNRFVQTLVLYRRKPECLSMYAH